MRYRLARRLQRGYQRGAAIIEMALLTPLLIALAVPVYFFARNMMAQHMITNVSRELANLDARTPSPDIQSLMNTVAATVTPPFDFDRKGMMFITEVQGADCDASGAACQKLAVVRHFVWLGAGHLVENSRIYGCPSTATIDPASGACNPIPAGALANYPALVNRLFRGQLIYIAEAFYDDPPQIGGLNLGMGINLPVLNGRLYSVTAF